MNRRDDDPFGENARRRGVLRPGVYENQGGVPLGAAVPPGYVPPPPSAQQVEVIEPTKGWWRNAGAFGQRYQGLPPALANAVIPLTEQLNLPGPPAPWWVQFFRFNRNQAGEADDPGNWELRGRLLYGVGGIQNQIDVDVIQGIQFPVVCNSLTVQLVSYAPTLFEPAETPETAYDPGNFPVTVGVMFGKGGGNGQLPVTYTTPWYQKGDQQLIITEQLPDFARSVVAHTSNTTDAQLQGMAIGFTDLAGQLLQEVRLGYSQGYAIATKEKGIPIPAGTNTVSLSMSHPTVASGTRGALQFFLAL